MVATVDNKGLQSITRQCNTARWTMIQQNTINTTNTTQHFEPRHTASSRRLQYMCYWQTLSDKTTRDPLKHIVLLLHIFMVINIIILPAAPNISDKYLTRAFLTAHNWHHLGISCGIALDIRILCVFGITPVSFSIFLYCILLLCLSEWGVLFCRRVTSTLKHLRALPDYGAIVLRISFIWKVKCFTHMYCAVFFALKKYPTKT